MNRQLMAAVLAVAVGFSAGVGFAAAPEPVGIALLRIEMKKNLLQQDAAPKLTELRKKKFEELQAAGKADDAADAEVDLIQAQASEAICNVMQKELDLQLKEAIKGASAPPTPPAPAAAPPAAPQPGPAQEPDMVASPTDIALLQYDLQKAQIQADAAKKVADNRQNLLAARQARADGKGAGVLADSEAEALAAQVNARLAGLEVEASQMRYDAAVKSAAPKR